MSLKAGSNGIEVNRIAIISPIQPIFQKKKKEKSHSTLVRFKNLCLKLNV